MLLQSKVGHSETVLHCREFFLSVCVCVCVLTHSLIHSRQEAASAQSAATARDVLFEAHSFMGIPPLDTELIANHYPTHALIMAADHSRIHYQVPCDDTTARVLNNFFTANVHTHDKVEWMSRVKQCPLLQGNENTDNPLSLSLSLSLTHTHTHTHTLITAMIS